MTATLTGNAIAATITQPFSIIRRYTDGLLKGINPADFARKPKGIDFSTPAFNFGHLAVYPERILEMIGRTDLVQRDEKWVELFSAGKPCLDDPTGTIYPSMDQIVKRFNERYEVAFKAVRETSDEVLSRPNPNEKMRDMLPTIGGVVAFLLDGHIQSHLGQVSVWRRIMGLGSAL